MRIACPDCGAAYDVPGDRLAPGRTVRCARCGGTWTPIGPPTPPPSPDPQTAPDPAPVADVVPPTARPSEPAAPEPAPSRAALPTPAPAPVGPDPLGATPPPRRAPRALLIGAWLISFAVLAGLGWAAITYRRVVIEAWPPSERGYFALGLVPRGPAPAHP